MMSNLNKKRQLAKDILIASYGAGACHIGSALSCLDILIKLFYKTLKKEDIFIFGKASGVATYYVVLADNGYFPKEKLTEYLKKYPLVSKEVPGVIWSSGSCGHGLSVACGLALADRMRRVYVLLSDGECQEGATYEAALFARQHKLKNLYVIIDNNSFQACGTIKDILDLETAFEFLKKTLPNCEIIKTIKGGNIDFLQGTAGHYLNLNFEQLTNALNQL